MNNGCVAKNKKIVIACGGTTGHILPGIVLGKKLKELGYEVVFFCSEKKKFVMDKEAEIFKKQGFSAFPVPSIAMPTDKNIFYWLRFFKIMSCGIFYSKKILKNISPSVVVGMGGFASAPVVFSAKMLNIPILIHEQNATPGRANFFLSKYASTVAVGIEDAKKYFKNKNVVYTGNLIKEDIFNNILPQNSLSKDKTTILVLGGSQGSHLINEQVLLALEKLPENIKSRIQVIHITGIADYKSVRQRYALLKIPCVVFDFSDKITGIYKVSNVAICRAGAGTITELCAFGLPAILIPHSAGTNHQVYNARWLQTKTGCIVIEEKELSPEVLCCEILRIIDKNIKDEISSKMVRLYKKDAVLSLVNQVINAK